MANEYSVSVGLYFEVSHARMNEDGEYEQVPREEATALIVDSPGHRFIAPVPPESAAWWRYLKAERRIIDTAPEIPDIEPEPWPTLDYPKKP